MLSWAFRIVLLAAIGWCVYYGYGRVQNERVCYNTTRCEDRLHSLEANLEIYSSDKVLDNEKESHKPDPRRAYYPASLDELVAAEKGTEEFTTCPVYGVKYVYTQLDGGKSFFVYCPARHRFHYEGQPFVNAVKPDQINLHLFVDGGKVMNLVGEHPNPWDFKSPTRVETNPQPLDLKNPTWAIVPTSISSSMFDMLSQNPIPVSKW